MKNIIERKIKKKRNNSLDKKSLNIYDNILQNKNININCINNSYFCYNNGANEKSEQIKIQSEKNIVFNQNEKIKKENDKNIKKLIKEKNQLTELIERKDKKIEILKSEK